MGISRDVTPWLAPGIMLRYYNSLRHEMSGKNETIEFPERLWSQFSFLHLFVGIWNYYLLEPPIEMYQQIQGLPLCVAGVLRSWGVCLHDRRTRSQGEPFASTGRHRAMTDILLKQMRARQTITEECSWFVILFGKETRCWNVDGFVFLFWLYLIPVAVNRVVVQDLSKPVKLLCLQRLSCGLSQPAHYMCNENMAKGLGIAKSLITKFSLTNDAYHKHLEVLSASYFLFGLLDASWTGESDSAHQGVWYPDWCAGQGDGSDSTVFQTNGTKVEHWYTRWNQGSPSQEVHIFQT